MFRCVSPINTQLNWLIYLPTFTRRRHLNSTRTHTHSLLSTLSRFQQHTLPVHCVVDINQCLSSRHISSTSATLSLSFSTTQRYAHVEGLECDSSFLTGLKGAVGMKRWSHDNRVSYKWFSLRSSTFDSFPVVAVSRFLSQKQNSLSPVFIQALVQGLIQNEDGFIHPVLEGYT